jgi:catechol 2,3-dioxygenase-like lactoylglutathione lyase family enzyme
MVTGLNHVTLAVRDLDRSFRFYTEALGLRPAARWYRGAYLLAGPDWIRLSSTFRRACRIHTGRIQCCCATLERFPGRRIGVRDGLFTFWIPTDTSWSFTVPICSRGWKS